MSVCCVVRCQAEASASRLSLCQSSPTEFGVSEYDHKASMTRRPWPTRGCCVIKKKISKLPFRQHADYIFFQTVLMLGLIQNVKFSFSTPDCVFLLNLTPFDLYFITPQPFGIL